LNNIICFLLLYFYYKYKLLKIISKEKVVDTTTLGTKKIVIVIENDYGKARDYQFFVKVKKAK
jgi:hypothetical protein